MNRYIYYKKLLGGVIGPPNPQNPEISQQQEEGSPVSSLTEPSFTDHIAVEKDKSSNSSISSGSNWSDVTIIYPPVHDIFIGDGWEGTEDPERPGFPLRHTIANVYKNGRRIYTSCTLVDTNGNILVDPAYDSLVYNETGPELIFKFQGKVDANLRPIGDNVIIFGHPNTNYYIGPYKIVTSDSTAEPFLLVPKYTEDARAIISLDANYDFKGNAELKLHPDGNISFEPLRGQIIDVLDSDDKHRSLYSGIPMFDSSGFVLRDGDQKIVLHPIATYAI